LTRGARAEPGAGRGLKVSNTIKNSVNNGTIIMAGITGELPPGLLPAVTATGELPAAITGFTGRDEDLAELLKELDPATGTETVLVSAIAGMAGVGKTELAIQAGHAAVDRGWFPGGVIFLNLNGYDESPMSGAEAVDRALRALQVAVDEIPPDPEERAARYRSRLAAAGGPVLIVADNARETAQVEPLRPGSPRHRLLVTSRNTLSQLGARMIDLNKLAEGDAVALLDAALRRARPADARVATNPAAAAELARLCGFLPLALQIAAARLVSDSDLPVAELAAGLVDESRRLSLLDYQQRAVIPMFELSYRHLSPEAARLFRLLTVNPGPDLSTRAAAVLADDEETRVREILDSLVDAHIVERVTTARGRWRMHDLLRDYARQLGDEAAAADDQDAASERLIDYYLDNVTAANERLVSGSLGSASGLPASADALGWLEAEHPNLVAVTIRARQSGHDRAACSLAMNLTAYLSGQGRVADLLTTTAVGRESAHDLGATYDEAMLLVTYGSGLRMARRFEEAADACRQGVDICAQAGEQAGEAQALAALGAVLVETREFAEALVACTRAEDILAGGDSPLTEAIALNNHSLALVEMERHADALPLSRRAVELSRESSTLVLALTLSNLGVILLNRRAYAEATTVLEESVALSRDSGMHIYQLMGLSNLAVGFMDTGQQDKALATASDALVLCRATGDRQHEASVQLIFDQILYRKGSYAESAEAGEEAVRIFAELSSRHGQARALRSLGQTLQRLKRLPEAADRLRESAGLARETGDDSLAGFAFDDLGDVLKARGQDEGAATAYLQAAGLLWEAGDEVNSGRVHENLRKVLKKLRAPDPERLLLATEGYPPARVVLTDLGIAVAAIGRFEEAAALCQQAIDASRTGQDRRSEVWALCGLSSALLGQERYDEAAAAAREAIVIAQAAAFGRGEASAWCRLGGCLLATGQHGEAAEAYSAAVEITDKLGARYARAGSLEYLAGALIAADRRGEGIDALALAVELYHETSRQAEGRTAVGLSYQLLITRRYDEAITMARRAERIFKDRGESFLTGTAIGIRLRAVFSRWWRRLAGRAAPAKQAG
jgi:tetratricopeptide (TPR) repeat protein